MDNMIVNNLVHIGNSDISVKEYDGRRVVTFKDIDMVHGRPEGTARKRFNNNKKRFIDGKDFFKVKCAEVRPFFGQTTPNGFNPEADIILITESGYLMLVKSFTDDLAWEVQRQLVDNYFRERQPVDDIVLKYIDRQQHFMEEQEQFNQMVMDKLERLNGDRAWRFGCDADGSFLRHINHEFDFDEKAIIEENKKELCKLTTKVARLCGVPHNSILHQIYKALEKKLGIELDAYRSVYRSETGNQSAGMIEVISAHTWIFDNAVDLCKYVIKKKNIFD